MPTSVLYNTGKNRVGKSSNMTGFNGHAAALTVANCER